jgi:hypothetical protein
VVSPPSPRSGDNAFHPRVTDVGANARITLSSPGPFSRMRSRHEVSVCAKTDPRLQRERETCRASEFRRRPANRRAMRRPPHVTLRSPFRRCNHASTECERDSFRYLKPARSDRSTIRGRMLSECAEASPGRLSIRLIVGRGVEKTSVTSRCLVGSASDSA